MSYKIAFFADTHLGYATKCKAEPKSGLNMRIVDGYKGFSETINDIIQHDVDAVVQGGDLFHKSHPSMADIVHARRQLNKLSEAGIPFYGNTGNHDFANDRNKSDATAAVEDEYRNINILTKPHRTYKLDSGINLVMVSHSGIIANERYVPDPIDGEVSIFTTHGAAAVPGHEMFACADSPGEAVIPYNFLTKTWDISLLGHYHQMGALPGFETGTSGQAWYAGSLLRRGFADKEGGRGWLLVTINDEGSVEVERKTLKQRPQFDFPIIDASEMTATEVEETIAYNIENHDIHDAIIRQRVINISPATRRVVDARYLKSLTAEALVWKLEFFRPQESDEYVELAENENVATSLATAKVSDMPAMWANWFPHHAEEMKMPQELKNPISDKGKAYLQEVEKNTK